MILVDNRNTNNPYVNLAIEEYLVSHADCRANDYLLLYVNTPCIVVGRNQSIYREVNIEYLRRTPPQLARRITGGGTVYHDEGNLNFTFITAFEHHKVNNYPYFNRVVIDALVKAGVPATADERNNIICQGKKISGSAQFTNRKNIISHGTLLFNANLDELRACLRPSPFTVETKAVASAPHPVMNLAQLDTAFKDLEGLYKHLVSEISINGTHTFTDTEWQQIEALAEQKFTSIEWVYGRSPKTTITKPGCKIVVEDGRITQLESGEIPAVVSATLVGALYEYTGIKKALELTNASQYLGLLY